MVTNTTYAALSMQNGELQRHLVVVEQESDRLRLQIEQLESDFATRQQSLNDQITALSDSESHWKSKSQQLESQLAEAGSEIAQSSEKPVVAE